MRGGRDTAIGWLWSLNHGNLISPNGTYELSLTDWSQLLSSVLVIDTPPDGVSKKDDQYCKSRRISQFNQNDQRVISVIRFRHQERMLLTTCNWWLSQSNVQEWHGISWTDHSSGICLVSLCHGVLLHRLLSTLMYYWSHLSFIICRIIRTKSNVDAKEIIQEAPPKLQVSATQKETSRAMNPRLYREKKERALWKGLVCQWKMAQASQKIHYLPHQSKCIFQLSVQSISIYFHWIEH